MMQTGFHNLRNLASLSAYFQVESDEANVSSIRRDEFETVCRKLNLIKDDKLLDVGCELMLYAAKEHGTHGIGITVNKPLHMKLNQFIAATSLRGNVVKLMDYRDLVGMKFDKAVCLDPFAAIGRKETVTLFGTVYNLLHPGSLFLVEYITAVPSNSSNSVKFLNRLVQRFDLLNHSSQNGFSPFEAIEQIVNQMGFEFQLVDDVSENYLLRLKHWLTDLQAYHNQIVRDTSEARFHDWYATASTLLHRIESRNLQCFQWLLSKPSDSHNRVLIPDSQRCCGSRNPD